MSKKARSDNRIEVVFDTSCKTGTIVGVARSSVPQIINLSRFIVGS